MSTLPSSLGIFLLSLLVSIEIVKSYGIDQQEPQDDDHSHIMMRRTSTASFDFPLTKDTPSASQLLSYSPTPSKFQSHKSVSPFRRLGSADGTVNPSTAAASPVPLRVQGECQAGTVYQIESVGQLEDLQGQWECVFNAGLVPNAIPLGRVRGKFLKVLNTAFYNPFLDKVTVEQYHQIIKTKCPQLSNETVYIDIAGEASLSVPVTYGWVTIGSIGPMKPEESQPPYVPTGLVVDYRVQVGSLCEPPSSRPLFGLPLAGPFKNNPPPIPNTLVNVARVVGRDLATGDLIWIQKSFSQSKNTGQVFTIAFDVWTTRFDSAVSAILPGDTIGPIQETYIYVHNSLGNFLTTFFPVR